MYYTEPHFKSFDGTPLYVRESGKGPLLLLIHGGATDADFYKDTAEILSESFHVISYDRRGHVRSGMTPARDILTAHAEDASALIRHFSAPGEPAYVVAHSLGGPIGMKLAELHPEQIRKLLLFEPMFELSRIRKQKDLRVFFPPVRRKDTRGRSATEEEIANIKPDSRAFLKYDRAFIWNFRVPYEALSKVNVLFAVSTQSQGTLIYNETLYSAERLHAPVLYYPGFHNCAFHLPREFAYLTKEAFLHDLT
ncbi:MAG: alpha/beta hydrolase [Clostridia bacterium]|nr:alpha/beta hydrolase [Clostridia bacterium]